MSWGIILFDLDGTLTESGPGIMKAAQYALRSYGIERPWQELSYFVGPPLGETFADFVPASEIDGIIGKFREYYQRDGWLDNAPYPGVREMLDTLRAAGKRLLVATSKLDRLAVQVLAHFDLLPCFEAVCGAPEGNPAAAQKASIVRAALARVGCSDPGRAVMVGDRKYDITGGHQAGVTAIGVLYGYGSREELTQAGADALAETPEALTKLILTSNREGNHYGIF